MPASPNDRSTDTLAIAITFEGKPVDSSAEILELCVESEINKIATAKITFQLENEEEDNTFDISKTADFDPGKKVEIKLGYEDTTGTVFKGIIVAHSVRARPGRGQILEIKCSDEAIKLTMGRKNVYFKDQLDSAIISSIIGDASLTAEVDATTFQHKQLIQYHASDWDFIVTRAENNGLLVYTEDGKVKVKKPEVSAAAPLELTYGLDVLSFSGEVDSRHQIPSITCNSWDPTKQEIAEGKSQEPTVNTQGNVTGKKLADNLGYAAIILQSSGPIDKADLKNWGNAQLLKSRLSRIQGQVSFLGNETAKLNTLISLKNFGERFNGNAPITKITHFIKDGYWQTDVGFGLSPLYLNQQHDVNTPEAGGLLPSINGLQIGTVRQIDSDPDGESRILVNVPMIEATGDGIWARLSNYYATSGKGLFFMPEKNDEVILGFINNDPRYAVILGMAYSKKNKPPYTADAENKIKAIVTKNDLKIEFDDDQKILTLETPGGNTMIFSDKDKSVTVKDQNGNKIAMTTSGIDINSAKDINIKATGSISMSATNGCTVDVSGGDIGLSGLNVNAKAQMAFAAQGSLSAEVKASGTTTIKGAMVMIN